MVAFRNLDENGDMVFGTGTNAYARNADAVKLDVKTRVLSFLNDCFFALDEGIDWDNRLGRLGQQNLLEDDIRRTIAQTPDVTAFELNSIDVTNRNLQVEYTVETTFSQSFQDRIERTL